MIKLKEILLESDELNILLPRRSVADRQKNYLVAIQRTIQNYIKNGGKGDLDLGNTPIETLPDNLTRVGGDLSLENTSNLKKLPDKLIKVDGSLDLNGSHIQSLPDGLFVGENLYLHDSHIKRLPAGLIVGNYLNLYGTLIEELPDNLIVGGSLTVISSRLEKLPIGLKVMGDFFVSGTPLSGKYTKKELKKLLPGVEGDIRSDYD